MLESQKGSVMEFSVESLETPALTKAQLAELLFDQIGEAAERAAGVALLRAGFADASVGAGGLLLGALFPTAVAMAALLLL